MKYKNTDTQPHVHKKDMKTGDSLTGNTAGSPGGADLCNNLPVFPISTITRSKEGQYLGMALSTNYYIDPSLPAKESKNFLD